MHEENCNPFHDFKCQRVQLSDKNKCRKSATVNDIEAIDALYFACGCCLFLPNVSKKK